MSLDAKEFEHLCRLARLAPDDTASARYAAECQDILDYMATLAEVDTSGVEPLYSPMEHGSPYREDIPLRKLSREEVLANAPLTDGEFFIVPRIVEGK